MNHQHPHARRVNLAIAIILLVIAASMGVVYAIVSFSQTTPQVTTPASPTLKPNCPILTVDLPGSSISAVQGAFELDCSGQPAIVSAGVSATPTFAFPNGLQQCVPNQTTECLSLGFSSTSCGAGVSVNLLTSGQSAPMPQGSFVYCLIYENAPEAGSTYSSFTISWS